MAIFTEVFDDVTKQGRKLSTSEYCEDGKYIIIDQGQEDIAGYTNEIEGVFTDVPAIVFGDHTRVIKYVDKPCFLGADGVKLLKAKEQDANYKYLYYALLYADIPNTGYNRHFKWLKEIDIKLPDKKVQCNIVEVLDKVTDLINKRHQQLDKLDELVKTRFIEMFGANRINPYNFEKKKLKETCEIITGNTPSRAVVEYYGDYIEWIKTDNIVSGLLNPTLATESLSEEGMLVGKTVEKDSILMACIAGSVASIGRVCVTNRKVAFNQQINAIVPREYNVLFLYILLQLSKDYLVEEINMALKGILSKSKLEDKLFIVPPMKKQLDFTIFVEQTNKSKVIIKNSLDELENLKKSLMQQYFG